MYFLVKIANFEFTLPRLCDTCSSNLADDKAPILLPVYLCYACMLGLLYTRVLETLSSSYIYIYYFIHIWTLWPVSSKDMQTPSPLRSGHIDIKDAQCAETKYVLKKSYRVFDLWACKSGVMGTQKLNFLQKWPNLHGRLKK